MSKEIERELLEEELDLGAETEDLVPDSVDMTEPLKIYLKRDRQDPAAYSRGRTGAWQTDRRRRYRSTTKDGGSKSASGGCGGKALCRKRNAVYGSDPGR